MKVPEYMRKLNSKPYRPRKEEDMNGDIPKARKLYKGDINAAVIAVQKATGIEINGAWWTEHVGNNGSSEEILDRFDKAYGEYVASKDN